MLCKLVAERHAVIQDVLQDKRRRMRDQTSKGKVPNFLNGGFVFVTCEDFSAGENLLLRCRGRRRIDKDLNTYVYQVEDLRSGSVLDVHASRFKFYHDKLLNFKAIMPHVLASETGMDVERLMCLTETEDGTMVQVRWRDLLESDDTVETLAKLYKDVPALVLKLFRH